jgi:hypothetical protein
MVWLYRFPIPVGRNGVFICSNNDYLPSWRLEDREGSQYPMAGFDHLLPAARARAGNGKRVQQCEKEKKQGIIEATVSVLNLASKGLSRLN